MHPAKGAPARKYIVITSVWKWCWNVELSSASLMDKGVAVTPEMKANKILS